MPIRAVEVRGIRGIRESLRLVLDGKSLLLHGANGTGKSSLERGLRWALTGQEEPTADDPFTTAESYRRHVAVAADFPNVKVTFTDGSSIAVKRGATETAGRGAALREACRVASPFLRRSELLDVLSSRPVDRFQYFESFLGLGNVDTAITGLAGTRSAIEARHTNLTQRLRASLEPLGALLPAAFGRPQTVAELEDAAGRWLEALRVDSQGLSLAQIATVVTDRADAAARGDSARQRTRFEQLILDAHDLGKNRPGGGPKQLAALVAEREILELGDGDARIAALLDHALTHFRAAPGDICPVCGAEIDWAATRSALEARTQALSRLREVDAEAKRLTLQLHSALSAARSFIEKVALEFGHEGDPLSFAGIHDPALTALAVTPQSDAGRTASLIGAISPEKVSEAIIAVLETGEARVLGAISQLPSPAETPALQTAKALFAQLPALLPQLKLLDIEAASISRQSRLLDEVLQALRRARQDVAREALKAIQDLVAEYYFTIHPRGTTEDATGAPSIDVQRHGKGSAFVRGVFHGHEVKDPQWVYSDGHLDTVGICIFLALRTFRARQPGDPKLMVLDDIIISIDLGHARRLIALLKEKFADHQVLILTHNGLFAHWCKSLIPDLRRVEIKSWSLADGPQLGDYPSAKEQIVQAIESGTTKEIAMRLMAFLDEWAAEARYEYALSVPAKPGEQYTLSDIWNPFVKAVKEMARAIKSDLGGGLAALEKLSDITSVRNMLAAHENDPAKEFPRDVLVGYAHAVLELSAALYCDVCNSFVTPIPNRQSPVMLHCRGHHKQYVRPPTALPTEP